ncbi:hypothetical protein PVAP13_3NG231415 [Panicum virgatum]|uniref:Uncharacterized protein n=1 Tax=Panicum virgatum TaxID=38727 RepID=A0A8T0UJU1_PANVG|nr:hypothetical protein PVAP13_3NG231415 [Panicum virgatum]
MSCSAQHLIYRWNQDRESLNPSWCLWPLLGSHTLAFPSAAASRGCSKSSGDGDSHNRSCSHGRRCPPWHQKLH